MKKTKLVFCASALLLALTLSSCGDPTTTSVGTSTDTTTTDTGTSITTSDNTDDSSTTSIEEVKVTGVIFSIEDENGEGTIEKPYNINVSQGFSTSVPYVVQPNNATNKELKWEVGRITEGVFTAANDTGVTVTKTESPATISVSETATGVVTVKASTQDGSNIETYININIESYVGVTEIAVDGLMPSEDEEYDYIFKTALGTTWDMSGDQLQRGKDILAGNLDNVKGLQIPRNLTYWPNLYNMDISVLPEEASDKTFTVSSSNEDVFTLKTDGSYEITGAGEAVVTIQSYVQPEIQTKIKVEVADSLYPGILKSVYDETTTSLSSSWNLDPAVKGDAAHLAAYDDWHLIMMQTNEPRGGTGDDCNQKIFYMGSAEAPYGIDLENHVSSTTGGDTTKASSLIWAKVNIPLTAKTFNVKIGSTGSAIQGEYRVVFVENDGTSHILSGTTNEGWKGFTGQNQESTEKFVLDESLLGAEGAMVIEHRVPTKDANAELSIKVLNFEGQVDPTGIEMDKTSGTFKPGDTFNLNAHVTPDNVTNGAINYYMDPDSEGKGVTVDGNGQVTIGTETPNGTYIIWAESVANPAFKISYTLTVDSGSQTKDWNNKDQILNGVGGEKWVYTEGSVGDSGVGEGVDLRVDGSEEGWSSIALENRAVKTGSFILTYGARTFVRATPQDQETFPQFAVKVTDAEGTTNIIKPIGSEDEYLLVNQDNPVFPRYDLSAYIGQTVTIEIGIKVGGHGVITEIHFEGNDNLNTQWLNKTDILQGGWVITGDTDSGVGEGVDLKNTGSYLSQSFLIGQHMDEFTAGFRVFVRSGETYPDVKVVVVCDNVETVIRANGVDSDTVHIESDEVQNYTYNLSSFIGKRVEIRIQLENNATHCVITQLLFN